MGKSKKYSIDFRGIEEPVYKILCFKEEHYLIQLSCGLSLKTSFINSPCPNPG